MTEPVAVYRATRSPLAGLLCSMSPADLGVLLATRPEFAPAVAELGLAVEQPIPPVKPSLNELNGKE